MSALIPTGTAQALAQHSQSKDLNPIEQAKIYKMLVDAGHGASDIAFWTGRKHVPAITQRIELLKLTEANQRRVADGTLPVGLAWYIARLSRDGQGYMTVRWTRGEFDHIHEAEMEARALFVEEVAAEYAD